MKEIEGLNGGKLIVREKGDPAIEGAGRKKNLFKSVIQEMSEFNGAPFQIKGFLMENGEVTDRIVTIQTTIPAVEAVVAKMFKIAAKGDVSAARWLSETGYGKNFSLGNDDDQVSGGFVVVLPSNNRS